jgi:hypothetical protein
MQNVITHLRVPLCLASNGERKRFAAFLMFRAGCGCALPMWGSFFISFQRAHKTKLSHPELRSTTPSHLQTQNNNKTGLKCRIDADYHKASRLTWVVLAKSQKTPYFGMCSQIFNPIVLKESKLARFTLIRMPTNDKLYCQTNALPTTTKRTTHFYRTQLAKDERCERGAEPKFAFPS